MFWLLVVVLRLSCVSSKAYRWYCNLADEPLETLSRDRSTGILYGDGRELINDNGDRRLESSQTNLRSEEGWTSAVRAVKQDVNSTSSSMMQKFHARKCWCANVEKNIYPDQVYYCVEPYLFCAIPEWWAGGDITPGCVTRTRRERFVRGAWPVILVWAAAMLTCVCCTKAGHQVYDYVLGKMFTGWNEWVANRIIRRDPSRANRLIREHYRTRRLWLERRQFEVLLTGRRRGAPVGPDMDMNVVEEQDGSTSVHELVLKTRIFKSEEMSRPSPVDQGARDDSEFGDDDNTCTICIGSIVDGHRIGELACEHVFHVECIKSWLRIRNICPLCQMPNAATPRRFGTRNDDITPDSNDIHGGYNEVQETAPVVSAVEETSSLPPPCRHLRELHSPNRNRRREHRSEQGWNA